MPKDRRAAARVGSARGTLTVPGQARWFIVGAGAMGTALAHRLASIGVDVQLLHHRGSGARRLLSDGSEHRVPFTSLGDGEPGSIRRLLLATKAIHLEAAMAAALPLLAEDAVAVTIANGLGFANRYAGPRGVVPLHRAVTTAAAFRNSPGQVVLAATGETHVGIDDSVVEPAPWFSDSLARLTDWHWEAAIDARVAGKFAINCIINPLTAVLGCRNGDLLAPGSAQQALCALCEETEPALAELGLWPAGNRLLDAVSAVCRATAANRSSMLQDRTAGRTTEIDFLTGELLRRAAGIGHDLPRNATLYARLTARE